MENKVISTVKKIDKKIEENFISTNKKANTPVDTSLKFTPLGLLLAADALQIKTGSNFKKHVLQAAISELLLNAALLPLKHIAKRKRPGGGKNSFPSGHTATCLVGSELLRQEFKESNIVLANSGYCISAVTAILRLYHKKHWFSDVITGAVLGLASVRLADKAIEKFRKSRNVKVREIVATAA
jgi:membrane-associated phospholipid phosphatase